LAGPSEALTETDLGMEGSLLHHGSGVPVPAIAVALLRSLATRCEAVDTAGSAVGIEICADEDADACRRGADGCAVEACKVEVAEVCRRGAEGTGMSACADEDIEGCRRGAEGNAGGGTKGPRL